MSENPKDTLKRILGEVFLLRDDGSQASVNVADEFTEQSWENYDAVLTVQPFGWKNETAFYKAQCRRLLA